MAPDVLVAGETLVDFLPERPGPLADVDGFVRRPGGAPANLAVGLARLDATPYLLTRVGRDPFGDFLAEHLAAEGVPDRFVQRDADRPTTLAFVTHDATGDPTFTFYRENAADAHLDAGAVPDATLADLSWVCVGGVALAAEPARSAVTDLVARAQAADCEVVFDPNRRPELFDGDPAPVLGSAVADADVVKATPGDLAGTEFATEDARELARDVVTAGPHTALVTRGEAGAVAVATADAPWGPAEADHPGFEVDVVDATGAGDAFLAGSLAALTGGESLAAALRAGNAVAACATTRAGAMAALPDSDEVEAFRASHDVEGE